MARAASLGRRRGEGGGDWQGLIHGLVQSSVKSVFLSVKQGQPILLNRKWIHPSALHFTVYKAFPVTLSLPCRVRLLWKSLESDLRKGLAVPGPQQVLKQCQVQISPLLPP